MRRNTILGTALAALSLGGLGVLGAPNAHAFDEDTACSSFNLFNFTVCVLNTGEDSESEIFGFWNSERATEIFVGQIRGDATRTGADVNKEHLVLAEAWLSSEEEGSELTAELYLRDRADGSVTGANLELGEHNERDHGAVLVGQTFAGNDVYSGVAWDDDDSCGHARWEHRPGLLGTAPSRSAPRALCQPSVIRYSRPSRGFEASINRGAKSMRFCRSAAAVAAATALLGVGAVAANAVPGETACADSPDGGYTLCLLWTDSDENQRRNDIVFVQNNDDPETDENETVLIGHVYQYEYGNEDSLFSGFGTGLDVLVFNLPAGPERLLEVEAEHGGVDDLYSGQQWTSAYVTYWDGNGHSSDYHASIDNGDFVGEPFANLDVGASHTEPNGDHFMGVHADEDDCGIWNDAYITDCPIHPGVPANPPPFPFLPIP